MNPIVFLKNVSIKQNNTPILTNINLSVEKGEFIYFIGKTGVGKSSLLRILYGDIIIKDGEAKILDTNLIKISVLRDKKEYDFQVQSIIQDTKDNLGNNISRKMIGIQIIPLNNEINRQKLGPAKAIYYSLKEIWFTISSTMSYVGKMIIGTEKADQLGGPIKIAQISGQVAELGVVPFLSIMAYISISLGLINLFPIPLLDGGHLLFYFYEFIRGKPLSEKVQTYFFKFGLFVLFSLMFFSTFNDLKSLGLF